MHAMILLPLYTLLFFLVTHFTFLPNTLLILQCIWDTVPDMFRKSCVFPSLGSCKAL